HVTDDFCPEKLRASIRSADDPVHPLLRSPSPLPAKQEYTPPQPYHPHVEMDHPWASDQLHFPAEATGSMTGAFNPGNELTSPKDEVRPATGALIPGNHSTSPTVELKSAEVVAPIADHSYQPIKSLKDPNAVLKQCKEDLLKEARTWNVLSDEALKSYMYFHAADDRRALKLHSSGNFETEWRRMEQLVARWRWRGWSLLVISGFLPQFPASHATLFHTTYEARGHN
ncbi:MAG: hypothetical protein LQ341_006639, partial [Variospora aurantia]